MNGIISSNNKVFTAAERKKIERLITNEYSEYEGNQPTIKVEKEKWGDKRRTKKSKVYHQSYLKKPKQKVVFSTSKAVTAKKVKEEKSNDVSLKSAFINYQKHYWKDVAVTSPTMKICQKTIVYQRNSLTEEEQLSYKPREAKDIKIRHYCCGRDIKNSFVVACDICDDWLHVNCINYGTGLATVAVTYVCQRCIHDVFLGVINFLHYQIKKKAWNDYETKNSVVLYQNMALEETLAFQSHFFISDSCNRKVTVHSQQGIKNEYFNCWFLATMQILLGTIIQEPLLKVVHSDDPMILQSLISFSAKLKSQLTCRNNNIQLSSDEVSISELCGIDVNSGKFCDPVEFLELFIEKTITRVLFDTKQIQILRCEGCSNLNGDIGRDSPVTETDIPEVKCKLSINEIPWNTTTGHCIAPAESRPCQSCSVVDEININCTGCFYFSCSVQYFSY